MVRDPASWVRRRVPWGRNYRHPVSAREPAAIPCCSPSDSPSTPSPISLRDLLPTCPGTGSCRCVHAREARSEALAVPHVMQHSFVMPSEEHLSKVGGIGAIVGVVVLFVATMLHPQNAHPGDAPAAFAEYAMHRHWVATHLAQLLGVVLVAAGLVALSWKLRTGRAGAWALLAGLSAVASVSLAAALQAVDGVALKLMVDRWAAIENGRTVVFEAAFAVRQIEVGLASLMGAFFGLTVILYGVAVAGAAALSASIVQAHAGFSKIAMNTSMPSTLLVLIWSVCVGVFLLRRSRVAPDAA